MKKGRIIAVMLFFLVAGFAGPAASQTGVKYSGVININTATEAQLRMLPLIDARLAHDIFMYRTNNGPFFTVDELKNVKGMTDRKLAELKPWLVTQGQTTFSPHLKEVNPGPVY
jgi:competence protein ComEA